MDEQITLLGRTEEISGTVDDEGNCSINWNLKTTIL